MIYVHISHIKKSSFTKAWEFFSERGNFYTHYIGVYYMGGKKVLKTIIEIN